MRTYCTAIFIVLAPFILPLAGVAYGSKADDRRDDQLIRAGREVAIESCTGCHVATRHQEFRPVVGATVPSFEEIANWPGITAASLRMSFDSTHRKRGTPRTSSIFATTYISDKEASEVIAYILTKKIVP
jgi:mono/diheme cytochrome c family protein